ncbi:MAG: plasminogen-binding N-terminal domain-containing protein [Campylobacterota bacterium]|nr:plasminogen-binding N-terminal domain-containing protein [Campylobacterota bacterium]
MKFIVLCLIFVSGMFASVVKSPLISVDNENNIATIKIENIDVGMSGFIVHKLSNEHSTILKNIAVESFDKETQIATLKISEYGSLRHSAFPSGKWKVQVGDTAVLAFGYTRGFLVAPSEEIYYRVTTATKHLQWIHPDIFATILSFNGHPTPLKEDFNKLSVASSVGLVFFYLDQKLYTLDAKSFKILNISQAPLVQDNVVLPFYMRVEEIDAFWWGEGSDELEEYEPHYYSLLVDSNNNNKELYEIIKNGDEKLHYLLDKFKILGK